MSKCRAAKRRGEHSDLFPEEKFAKFLLVGAEGFEPSSLAAYAPEAYAYTNSATHPYPHISQIKCLYAPIVSVISLIYLYSSNAKKETPTKKQKKLTRVFLIYTLCPDTVHTDGSMTIEKTPFAERGHYYRP